ncbi:GNAT family N-acetyltransferase [Planococcus sp. N028]|uniref:Lipid II:glycine glycyltransferase n=1 Tax=Planococcus shixiaomingii TaxID=3058393 RepID=A0ABT8N154_9BACL|nr:GNAT family N-acetyltransferase [Planococcus sp. N028]MDN7241616.1 GNAT family N-acetyltransferase [Planococcus sp. N028]
MLNVLEEQLKMEVIETNKRWNEVVNKFEKNDVYYTFEYCDAAAIQEGGIARLIYFKNDHGKVIYPIILRKIEVKINQPLFDIITPYGYGGPLLMGGKEVLEEFKTIFHAYCKANGIVTEVIRFHPLLNNVSYLGSYCDLQYIRKTTAIDLKLDLRVIRKSYSKMNKRNINKARKHGLQCREVEKSLNNIAIFLKLYRETMNRKNANNFYYFDEKLVKQQLKNTAISKSHLLFTFYGEKVISAVILFTTPLFAHYHLGASDAEYLSYRPNNLIFDYMVEVAKKEGSKLLHLGGGYHENDSLFKYKISFTNNNLFDYFIGKNIFDQKLYNEIVATKTFRADMEKDYFPLYRSV